MKADSDWEYPYKLKFKTPEGEYTIALQENNFPRAIFLMVKEVISHRLWHWWNDGRYQD
jgi:hypothetical protein